MEFVKSSLASDQCTADGKPIGVIGEGLKFGLTQMAVGISNDVDEDAIETISYYMNVYMTCAPGDAAGACEVTGSFYDSWLKWAGSGLECGYDPSGGLEGGSSGGGGGGTTESGTTEGTDGSASGGRRRLDGAGSVIVDSLGSLFRAF